MERNAHYPHITDALAAAHPEWVQWSDRHGWLPRVAGGADEGDPGDDSGEEGTGDDTGSEGQDDTDDKGGESEGSAGEKTLTQAQVDELVKKRLGRERKAWEKEAADKAEKESLSESDRLKAEKEEAEQAAKEHTDAANQRIIRSEAKVAAVAAGVKPDRATKFLKILDLDDVDLDDDGEPDGKAIAAAVKATLEEFPEFKGTPVKGASGGEHGDPPKTKPKTLQDAVAAHYA